MLQLSESNDLISMNEDLVEIGREKGASVSSPGRIE